MTTAPDPIDPRLTALNELAKTVPAETHTAMHDAMTVHDVCLGDLDRLYERTGIDNPSAHAARSDLHLVSRYATDAWTDRELPPATETADLPIYHSVRTAWRDLDPEHREAIRDGLQELVTVPSADPTVAGASKDLAAGLDRDALIWGLDDHPELPAPEVVEHDLEWS